MKPVKKTSPKNKKQSPQPAKNINTLLSEIDFKSVAFSAKKSLFQRMKPRLTAKYITSATCLLLAVGIAVKDYYSTTLKESIPPIDPAIVIDHEDQELVVKESHADEAVSIAMEEQPTEKNITHTIAKKETILSILLSLGLDREHAAHAIKELQKVYNPKALKVGQEVRLSYKPSTLEASAQLISIDFKTHAGNEISLKYENETFTAKKFELQLTKELRLVEGSIHSSFYSAAIKKGAPASIVKEAISCLSYEVDWQRDPQQGDNFKILFEVYVDPDGTPIKYGEMKFAAFSPSGNWKKIYAFHTKSGVGYYNEKGQSVVKALLQTPVDPTKMRVTSKFGRRVHPIEGYSKMHKGVDFGAPTGTPVSSAGDGVVVKAGWNGAYGNYVLIKHNSDYATAYAHLSKVHVKPGQAVKQRQLIGNVGTTGRSTGPHLHYEVIFKGQQINPQSIKQMPSVKLNDKDMAKFQDVKLECDNFTPKPILIKGDSAVTQVASSADRNPIQAG